MKRRLDGPNARPLLLIHSILEKGESDDDSAAYGSGENTTTDDSPLSLSHPPFVVCDANTARNRRPDHFMIQM